MKYVTGTPSLEESCGLWKADLQEPDLEDGEYFSAYESLCEQLELRYPRGEWPPDLYVRGDCFGDKTQYVYFYRPEVMTVEFLSFLQQWLRTYGKNAWRILVATEIGNAESVMVYPNAYFRWATQTMSAHPESADHIPNGLALARWSWDGPV
jgi:hypothetical protein